MMYAIEMYFDKVTEEKIMRLAQKIADAGLSTKYLEWKTRPHVTLAVYNDIDVDRCAQLLEKFANDRKEFPALFDAVGMYNYTKTIFLSPIMTRSLYELHSELYALMTSGRCVAVAVLLPLSDGTCELKNLAVEEASRGMGYRRH